MTENGTTSFVNFIKFITGIIIVVFVSSCNSYKTDISDLPFDPSDNPWSEIRRERIQKLLPAAMQRAEVDAWVLICRENDNDPLASHVGCENAGGTAAFMFFLEGDRVNSLVFSPEGEAKSLSDVGLHDRVISFKRGGNVWKLVADELRTRNPSVVAINSSERNIADGLSYSQRIKLEEALGDDMTEWLVSS